MGFKALASAAFLGAHAGDEVGTLRFQRKIGCGDISARSTKNWTNRFLRGPFVSAKGKYRC